MTCNTIILTLNNRYGVEMRGCILYGYRGDQKVAHDGVRPVGVTDGISFRVSSDNMTHWQWIAAVDYSDEPENSDVVLMDTGKRLLTKCDWSITARPPGPGGNTNFVEEETSDDCR